MDGFDCDRHETPSGCLGTKPKPAGCENGGVSQTSRFGGRRSDAAFRIPDGETLATFPGYLEAQELVNSLVTQGVPAQALSIVGADVTLVERVTGKIGYGRAAVSSAMSGSWLGILAGLVFVIISPSDFITPIVGGLFIGAGVGMVTGMVIFTFSKGPKRLYRSMQQVIAQSYRVVVDTQHHAQATQVLESGNAEGES